MDRERTSVNVLSDDMVLAAVANLPGGSVNVFDRSLRYLFAGGRGLQDVGLDPSTLIGRTLSEIFGEAADAAVRPYYLRAFDGETVAFQLPVGGRLYQVSAAPLPRYDAIVAVAQEIREQRAAYAAAEQPLSGPEQAIFTLVHEIRQPLSAMRMSIEVMRKRIDVAVGQRAREVVDRQVQQLERLTEDLIDAARVTQGRITIQSERLNLVPIVESELIGIKQTVGAKQLRLSVELPADPVWLHGDANRMQQVFSNLLQNATKFANAGGAITITMVTDGREVVTRVRNTGAGIRSDLLPRIFEPFVQGDVGKGGLGLGLSLVKRLVEAHRGTVTVDSRGPDEGAEFTIRLPIR